MFTIKCFTARYLVNPLTRKLHTLESPEEVGYIILSSEGGHDVGDDGIRIFKTGCEAIHAIADLTGNGEDLIYLVEPYRTSKP